LVVTTTKCHFATEVPEARKFKIGISWDKKLRVAVTGRRFHTVCKIFLSDYTNSRKG
jgi:hypothetical protein